jgi:hypothetical protein
MDQGGRYELESASKDVGDAVDISDERCKFDDGMLDVRRVEDHE